MAPLLAGGADPNLPLDEQGNTLLHKAQSPAEIAELLNSPLIDTNVTNKVRGLLLAIDIIHTRCSPAHTTPTHPQPCVGWPDAAPNACEIPTADGATTRRRS